jgi:ketosteroid isomerase-like protein
MRFVALVMTCLAAIAAAGQPSATADEFLRLESVWNQAHTSGDAAALDRLWSDDLEVAVPRMPVMSKSQALAFARSGRMHFEKYETSDVKVRIYGETAVVTGRLQRTRTIESKQMSDDWRFTKVYARQKGEWRVVSFHASEAPSQP